MIFVRICACIVCSLLACSRVSDFSHFDFLLYYVLDITSYAYIFFFLMIRRPPRSTLDRSSAASDVYKRQQLASVIGHEIGHVLARHSNERMSQKLGAQIGISLIAAVAAPQTAMGRNALSLLGVGAEYGLSLIHISEPTRPY